MNAILALDIATQRARIRADLDKRINAVLDHGRFILGPEVTELEKSLAHRGRVAHAVTCGSGTDALLMSLMAWDIGPGDAVITTPFTFIATVEVVSLLGATPVFVDIDPATFNIDPENLDRVLETLRREGRLTPRAIIAVDLYGLPADYAKIRQIAQKYDLKLLADAAQSFGATYHNQPVGCLGDATAISFFPSKPLGCYGDGGAILTDDGDFAESLRSIRMHGKGTDKYDNVRIGLNSRLDTLQAAVLLAKLPIFEDELAARNAVARKYSQALSPSVTVPYVPEGSVSAWAQYSIQLDERDGLARALEKVGIPSAVYYPKPLHLQTAYADLAHRPGDFPVAEAVSAQVLSLPMHPYLSDGDIDRIVAGVSEFVNGTAA